jgi:hypothetical protein
LGGGGFGELVDGDVGVTLLETDLQRT